MLNLPWQFGIPCLVLGSVSSAAGLLAMKASTCTESHLPLHRRKRWLIGFILLVVIATAINMIALSLVPLSIIAPFSALTIVFSTLLAQFGLFSSREVVTLGQIAAIAVVCAGVSIVALMGPHSSKQVTEDNVQDLLYSRPCQIFAGLSILCIGAAMGTWVAHRMMPVGTQLSTPGFVVALVAGGAASCGAITQMALKVMALSLKFGGAYLELRMILGLAATVLFAPLQLLLLNAALAWSPTSFAVPIYQTLLVLLAIVGAGTFFDEFRYMNSGSMAGFIFGLSLAIIGMLLILQLGARQLANAALKQSILA